MEKMVGYDPILLTKKTEKVVVRGNKRKYGNLARTLRFYGGVTSAQEVGCNLRCKFCFSEKPVRRPHTTGRFYSPKQVFSALAKNAQKNGHRLISASASEGTLGKEHLFGILDEVEKSNFIYILETNGITIGNDPEFARELSKYKKLHVRVSIKGACKEEYHKLTGASPKTYSLAFNALEYLIRERVSCNICIMRSFSTDKDIKSIKKRLYSIWPGLLKSLEDEYITLFPRVHKRLKDMDLHPHTIRRAGSIRTISGTKEPIYSQ